MQASFSLAAVEEAAKNDFYVANLLRRVTVSTYDEFLDVLYDDVKLVIERLEDNPQNYPDESEDATTQRIADILWGMQYDASHNTQAGGNVDLTVSNPRRQFKWIAEAKKFADIGDMREGYLQLATRYRPGMAPGGVMYGGLIGYLHRPNAAEHIRSWRDAFASLPVASGNVLADCARRYALGFNSEHNHQTFGIPLRVWHTCVVLHFAPEDRSGRTAKRYKAK
ncbi:hypothetical protein [Polaromonas sp. JS666]|uniref:hypothetical protein n=1 Tax=Polaromonas sp. (strain JS666 / ATCC BAA-500) TaxID=296591 RepID=UPI000880F4AA|nr:hypothetical protein [Polaromonas sp. JS666]SDO16232.1 hypothetical protein SAMN05720382_11610 [Polaromonas sp. JS666]